MIDIFYCSIANSLRLRRSGAEANTLIDKLEFLLAFRGDFVNGPFRPGAVTFKVTLGGRVLATATAVVRAGTYETLRIPRLRSQ